MAEYEASDGYVYNRLFNKCFLSSGSSQLLWTIYIYLSLLLNIKYDV
jgi:hypothetical protein